MKKLFLKNIELKLMLEKGLTNVEMGSILGCSKSTIERELRNAGLRRELKPQHPDLIKSYFENICTVEQAYWLGFLCADGYISPSGYRLTLDLSYKDYDHLYNFCIALGANVDKITHRIHKKGYKSVKVSITCKQLVQDLIKLGCINKKSLVLRLVSFENDALDLAYLMGYFDGDGSQDSSVMYSASLVFLEAIKKRYNIEFEIKQRAGVYNINIGADLKRKMLRNFRNSLERKRVLYRGDKHNKTNGVWTRFRKVPLPPLDLLYSLIESHSYVKIGKMYGVSDNAVRKWFKSYGVDPPKKIKTVS